MDVSGVAEPLLQFRFSLLHGIAVKQLSHQCDADRTGSEIVGIATQMAIGRLIGTELFVQLLQSVLYAAQ